MQIRTRLTLQFSALVAAIMLVTFSIIYAWASYHRTHEFRRQLWAKATTSAELLIRVQEVDSVLLRLIDHNKQDVLPSEHITIFRPDGRVAYQNNDSIDFRIPEERLEAVRSQGEQYFEQGEFEVVALPYETRDGIFVVTAGAVDRGGRNFLASLLQILAIVAVCGFMVVGISGWIYAGRALRPIKGIVRDMRQISATNLDARLDEGNQTDEIARLAHSFNTMLERLENAFILQKSFVANVSHELKNPLTKITAQLEVALLRDRDPETYRRTLASVLEDVQSLNRAALALMDLARVTANDSTLQMIPTRIDEIIWQCREKICTEHAHYQILVDFQLPEDDAPLVITGNEYLLATAFQNLMENGCKFSPDHRMTVALGVEAVALVVQFIDHGIGIPQEDLEHIFQPFFRGKNASAIEGHGIGLPLVASIIASHGATIHVDSKPGERTIFTAKFPIAEALD